MYDPFDIDIFFCFDEKGNRLTRCRNVLLFLISFFLMFIKIMNSKQMFEKNKQSLKRFVIQNSEICFD